MKLNYGLPLFILLLTVSGCSSLQPQTLHLSPQPAVQRQLPGDTRIFITAQDLRSQKPVGQRLSMTGEIAPIQLANPITMLINSARDGFSRMGVTDFSAGNYQLDLQLMKLDYQADPKGAGQQVDVEAALNCRISLDNRSYTASFNTHRQQRYLSTPDTSDNHTLLNDLLRDTLGRCFNDPELLDFIQFRGETINSRQ